MNCSFFLSIMKRDPTGRRSWKLELFEFPAFAYAYFKIRIRLALKKNTLKIVSALLLPMYLYSKHMTQYFLQSTATGANVNVAVLRGESDRLGCPFLDLRLKRASALHPSRIIITFET